MTLPSPLGRLPFRALFPVVLMILGGCLPAAAQMLTAWGANGSGQTASPALPSRVVGVSAGTSHSLALLEDGTVAAWGFNSAGQISVPAGLSGVTAIAAGETHSLALKSDGTVVVWGYHGYITQPAGLAEVIAIAAGGSSLALRANGTVLEWDSSGQSTGRVPATLSGVTAIAASAYHSMALKSDGTIVTWSRYSTGQVTTPPALPPAAAIAAGSSHFLALLRDGTVAAWGDNYYGQSNVPAGLQDVVAIAAGGSHSLALKADGTLVDWGSNRDGQTSTPTGSGRILTLSAGGSHNLALTESSAGEPPVILSPSTALTNAAGTAGAGLLFTHRIVATGSPVAYTATGLPPGLTLDPATGIISGVTSQPGEFAVTLSAQNAAGTATQLLRLRVQGAPHFVGPPAVLALTVPQNLQNLAANLPNQWTAAGLPPGLTIHPVTGAITGTPSQRGVYDVHFVFSNDFGQAEADWQVEVSSVIMLGTNEVQPAGLGQVTGFSDYAGTRMFLRADGTVTSNSWLLQIYTPEELTGVTGVAAGPAWGLALRNDGTVAAWPNADDSYYSIDAPTDQSGVVAIAAGHSWHSGSSDRNFGFALRNDGTVAAFGGFWATYDLNPLLQAVSGVVAVSGYERIFHAVKSDGTVFSIGEDYYTPPVPNRYVNRPEGLNEVIAVSTNRHTLALKRNGTVVAWGANYRGQCNVPAGLTNVIAVAAGEQFSLALKQDGTVVSWGGSLGGAVPVTALHGVVAIAAGSTAMALCGLTPGESPVIISPTAAITTASTSSGSSILFHYQIMATGTPAQFTASGLPQGLTLNTATGLITGEVAQPGDYDVLLGATNATGTGTRPLRIHVLGAPGYMSGLPAMFPSTNPAIQLYASNGPNTWSATGLPSGLTLNNTTGMLSGTVQDPGLYPVTVTIRNAFGAIQVSESIEVPSVLRLGNSPYPEVPPGMQRIAAAAVSDSVLLLDESGTVHARYNYGLPANLNDIVALGPYGSYHDMALRGSGEVVAWGNATYPVNIYGENTVPRDLTTAVAVAAGAVHSLALRANGTVAAWGWSEYGQTIVPPSLGDVVAIAAGDRHSLALRSDGTVAAWGANYYGESTVPNGLANVIAIAAGESHSMALTRGGTVVVWGDNDYGQRNVPTGGLSGVVAISSGWNHCAALKSDGRVVVWGHDYYGQTAGPSSLRNIAAISAGQWQTMLIMGRPAGARPVIVSPKRAMTSAAGTAGPGLQFSYRIAATGLPTSFSASGLPAGLTLSPSTGVISGLPEEAGEYEITVRATNAGGTGSALVRLYVLGVPQLLEPEIQINAAAPVQRQIHASAAPVSWSATGLPDGLTLNAATGVLSGMTAAPGIYRIPLTFANTRYTGTAWLRLLIMPPRDASQAAYAAWRDTFWKPDATNKDPGSDADGDGRSNLLEFALGTDPRSADWDGYLQFFYNSGGRLEIQVSVTKEAAAALLIRAQFSRAPDFGPDRVETLAAEPVSAEPPGKVRLRFVQPEAPPDEYERQFGRIIFALPQ